MGKYRGLDTEQGWIQRRFAALERALDEERAARRLVIATAQVQTDLNSMDLASGFTTYALTHVDVPVGYAYALIQASANVGTSLSGTTAGNTGCQIVVAGNPGPSMSQGKTGGGAVSAATAMSIKIPVIPGIGFDIWVSAYANGGPSTAGTGNVHLSATVIFTRG